MTITPAGRLLFGVAAWTGLAVAAVLWPGLRGFVAPTALLLCAVVVADALLLWREPAVALERALPERLVVGVDAAYGLVVRNPGRRTRRVELVDELPRALAPGDPAFADVELGPGASRELSVALQPRVRGDHELGTAVALASSPFGLLRRRSVAGRGQHLRAYPDTRRFLRRDVLDPRAVLARLGVKPARRRGEGSDFESLRDYVRGDDPRRLDWRASARRGKLVTRLYQHERSHAVVIAVDTSRLMGARTGGGSADDPTKLDHAVEAALALVYASLAGGDRTSLVVFDGALRSRLGPKTRTAELGGFVDALCPLRPRLVEPDYRTLVREMLVSHKKRSLVVVLTDFGDADASEAVAPLALLGRRHRVLVVALRDPVFDELDAASKGRGGGARAAARSLHRRIALDDLSREREALLVQLRRRGLDTLDLAPTEVVAPVLNRFLALRQQVA